MSELTIDFAPLQPPTAAYRDRWQAAAWRDSQFPPTQSQMPRVRFLNLELEQMGSPIVDVAALQELILPLARGIKNGAFGRLALGVITSDEAVGGFISYLAREHGVPLFLTPSVENALANARPAGGLTPSEDETLDRLLALGGRTTSAQFASAAGLEPAAAGNRLSNLEKKGYVFRLSRPRHQGDIFVDPRAASLTLIEEPTRFEADDFIPDEIRLEVLAFAAEHQSSPKDVLADVWRAYFRAHKAEIDAELERVDALIASGDEQALLDYTTADAAERAAAAARRHSK